MKDPIQFFAALFFLLYVLFYSYKPWFRPEKFISEQRKRRAKHKVPRFLLPHRTTSLIFQNDPKLELWSTRIISLIGIMMGLIFFFYSLF